MSKAYRPSPSGEARWGAVWSYIPAMVWHERWQNVALFVLLFIVSCVTWFLVDMGYALLTVRYEPDYFRTDHCYLLETDWAPKSARIYNPDEVADHEHVNGHLNYFMDELRRMPEVEYVGVSILEHDGIWGQANIYADKAHTDRERLYISEFSCTPDIFDIFQYESAEGMTTDEMKQVLERGELLITENVAKLMKWDHIKGDHRVLRITDTRTDEGDSVVIRIGGIIRTPKISKWMSRQSLEENNLYLFGKTDWLGSNNLIVRVKPGREHAFEDRMAERIKNYGLSHGSLYVTNVKSYADIERHYMRMELAVLRYFTVFILFLLVNVFLGLLGTFWFRTQRRFAEIGLQKAIGASNRTIALRLLAEAMLIFAAAFLPSLLVGYAILKAEWVYPMGDVYYSLPRFLTAESVTFLLMTLIICLGLAFPARRAMKANPTDVLRDE